MSEKLINSMLQNKAPEHIITHQIIKRAGGNPFFIEEVIRSFIDEGALIVKNGQFHVTDKIKGLIVPHTVNDVLQARIDRLEEKTRDLVKIASVIGRTFFYRILAEVANDIEGIDSRLDYLKETQLIRERLRMNEIEYIFNHAIAQEVAYESILIHKRKEIHLKVAVAIESIFKDRLHDFYGMLAFHYGKGENEEKTVKYLIKSGEEALKSSASNEAIKYYQEGLRLYSKKYAGAIDPIKVALFEKKVALAFFNKGQHNQALEYFDRSLERLGIKTSKNKIITTCMLLVNASSLLLTLYLPSRKAKKNPSRHINDFFDLLYKRAILLVYVDPKRSFAEFIKALRMLNRFNISKIENGFGMWMSSSLIFSWAGISHKISKTALEYAKGYIDKKNVKEVLYYEFFELLYHYFTGKWPDIKDFDDQLVEANVKSGEFWLASTYIVFHGFTRIAQGLFEASEALIDKLNAIARDYENADAREYRFSLRITLLMGRRRFEDALEETNAGIAFQRKSARDSGMIYYLGFKSSIYLHLGQPDEAKKALSQAEELVSKVGTVAPLYISTYLLARFLFALNKLENAIMKEEPSEIRKYKKSAFKNGRHLLKNARKFHPDMPESFKLMGRLYWLMGKQKKAIKFWQSSIGKAQYLNVRCCIAQTYLEIGKRLLEEKSRFTELNHIPAEKYLQKARVFFK